MLNLQESSDVLSIAGFGPIVSDYQESHHFYVQFLKLPLKPLEEGNQYLICGQDSLEGAKHFALWPIEQAAVSCFKKGQWPADIPRPQSWIEFEVSDIEKITQTRL